MGYGSCVRTRLFLFGPSVIRGVNQMIYLCRMVSRKVLKIVVITVVIILLTYLLFHFRNLIYESVVPRFQSYRASKIPGGYSVHGLDVSMYQGRIDWDNLGKINKSIPVDFVIMRATMGGLGQDREFRRNWKAVKKKGLVRGAYHYYNPDVNSILQAENFILTVDLEPGDLPPVLDIEKVSNVQNMADLRRGVQNWLDRVHKHYGVRPILYSGASFYHSYLRDEFDEYPLWVANYRRVNSPTGRDWIMWQFTEKGTIPGIRGFVDMNVFAGSRVDLERLRIKDE
jgi:lysozyme